MPRQQINYVVGITTAVVHQKREGSCLKVVLADMTTIIIRMNNGDSDPELDLTPQIMIDRGGTNDDSIAMCTEDRFGLEKINVHPWSRLPREIENYSEEDYETPPDERYRIQKIIYIDPNEIVDRLIHMFSEYGYRYPCVGIMIMGEFAKNHVALAHAHGGLPYRHDPDATLIGSRHALLIVGVNTMSRNEEEHYCLVKNSYGEKWGDRGYSRVGFEVFLELLYPIQQTPAEMKLQADYEAYLNKKGKRKRKVLGG